DGWDEMVGRPAGEVGAKKGEQKAARHKREPTHASLSGTRPRPFHPPLYFSTIVTVISIRSFGKSFWPRGAFTILSATSMPRTTSPNTVYWRSRKGESFTTMKNCEPALLGSLARAMETIPRVWDLPLNSAFS